MRAIIARQAARRHRTFWPCNRHLELNHPLLRVVALRLTSLLIEADRVKDLVIVLILDNRLRLACGARRAAGARFILLARRRGGPLRRLAVLLALALLARTILARRRSVAIREGRRDLLAELGHRGLRVDELVQ